MQRKSFVRCCMSENCFGRTVMAPGCFKFEVYLVNFKIISHVFLSALLGLLQ